MDYDLLEKLNREKQELAASPALMRAKVYRRAWRLLRRGHFRQSFAELKSWYLDGWSRQVVHSVEQPDQIRNIVDCTRAKIAVFSVSFADPASLPHHLVHFANADCILYVADPERYRSLKDEYLIRKIPDEYLQEGRSEAVRFIKMHPGQFLNGYDYAIYMEDDIRIMADVRQFAARVPAETGLAMHADPWRDDAYEQIDVIRRKYKRQAPRLERQKARYKGAGFPAHFGLFDTSLIVTDLKSERAQNLLHQWWIECLKSLCREDQTALPFVLWENDVVFEEVGFLGNDLCRNPKLETGKLR